MDKSKPEVNPQSLPLSEIVIQLGSMIRFVRKNATSTHEKSKEVYGALKTLLSLPERKYDEWIPLIATRYVPDGLQSKAGREYFRELLLSLLVKFKEETKGFNPTLKSKLAKIIRKAVASAYDNPSDVSTFFIKEPSQTQPNPHETGGEST